MLRECLLWLRLRLGGLGVVLGLALSRSHSVNKEAGYRVAVLSEAI